MKLCLHWPFTRQPRYRRHGVATAVMSHVLWCSTGVMFKWTWSSNWCDVQVPHTLQLMQLLTTIAIPAAAQLVQFDPTRLPGHASRSKSGSLACFKVTRKKVDWEDLPKDVHTRKYHIVWKTRCWFQLLQAVKNKTHPYGLLCNTSWFQSLKHWKKKQKKRPYENGREGGVSAALLYVYTYVYPLVIETNWNPPQSTVRSGALLCCHGWHQCIDHMKNYMSSMFGSRTR